MPFPGPLFERAASAPPVPRGLPLVIALTGFTDAGSAVSRAIDYFRDELSPSPLAVFSNDTLLDYRARRPIVSFEKDHLTDYRPPRLELSFAHDALGQPFLLLAGYEPDFAWDAFADAVLRFRRELGVVDGDVGARHPDARSAHAADRHDGERHAVRAHRGALGVAAAHPGARDGGPSARVPARRSGARIAGFVLLIPHYLGDTEYPAAALAALDSSPSRRASSSPATTCATRTASTSRRSRADRGQRRARRMVQGLEERYDAYMAGSTLATPMIQPAICRAPTSSPPNSSDSSRHGRAEDDKRGS